jgi:hypothetical protein
MTELKVMKEWNPQKGDVFRYHHENGIVGNEHTFSHWHLSHDEFWVSEKDTLCVNGTAGKWELVRRAAPAITMDKKWAQRQDPTKEVRILCVDGPDKDFPIIYLDESGNTLTASPTGSYFRDSNGEYPRDLVPLQEKVADVWMIVRNNGSFVHNAFKDKEACKEWVYLYGTASYQPYKIVRMTEVEGEYYEH